MPWLRKHTLLTLRKLCGSSMLYPSWYALKGITDYKSRDDGGMFGDIYSGKQGSLVLCLKLVRLTRTELAEALKLYAKEAIVWGQLRHPNIVPFYGIFYFDQAKEKICLVSPWMDNGNIEAYLKENPDAPRKLLVHDVALGLEYLHNENIIHGDLKAMNILVDQFGRACIADFGSSIIRVDRTLGFTNATGSIASYSGRWASPELVQDDVSPTRASDVWAFGCVCYEILSRRLPFHSMKGANASFRILLAVGKGNLPAQRDKEPEADPRDKIDDDLWELMNRCWSRDSDARPTCREILKELESQGVRERDNKVEDATTPVTIASTGTTNVDLNEVQGILDDIDTAEAKFSPVSEAHDILSTNRRLSKIMSSVLGDPQKSQALQELRDDRAQLLVDFLPLVSTRSFLSSYPQSDLATRATATLCQLCEALGLYPQRYVLTEVTLDPVPRAGDFCDIHRGRHGEQLLCVKVFKQVDVESVPKVFMKDAIQWTRLDHPNITPLYGIHYLSEGPKQFCVVTPWRESSTLAEYLQMNPSMSRENFIYDIISGLEYLHDADIVHGRLKMSNVLVDYLGRACITDLGMLAVRTASGVDDPSITGHLNWSAPELSSGRSLSKPCDIWAFGCICYEVITMKELSGQSSSQDASMLEMDEIDAEMQELIKSCLVHESKGRPTAQDIAQGLEARGLRERRAEIWSYLVHRDEVIKTRKAARSNSVMAAEKALRVQYIFYKANGDEVIPNRARNHLAISGHLIHLLASVLSTQRKTEALLELHNDHAQLILDFVDVMASHPDLQSLRLREQWHDLLHHLFVASGLCPQSYLLNDIVINWENTEFGEYIRKGHYHEQPLYLEVVWVREQVELSFTAETLSRAAAIWSRLHHPNIWPFYGVYFPNGNYNQPCLVSPWMANGDLREFLDENPSRPRKSFIYDIAKGLQYLHSQDIIHKNLNGSEVAVNDIGQACIMGFSGAWVGPGTAMVTVSSLVTGGFAPNWEAPESLGDEFWASQATDIWRFGCVCYEVMVRQNPYHHISNKIEILRAITEGKLPTRPEGKNTSGLDQIDDDMWGLMNRCWTREPEDRPTADQIVDELESWGLGRHEDDDFQNFVLEEHQIIRDEMKKHPNVEVDLVKVQEILEEVDALQDD